MTTIDIRWFTDSPDAGLPECICSFCGLVISDEDAPAIRALSPDQKFESRFHVDCFNRVEHVLQGQEAPVEIVYKYNAPDNFI